MSLTFQGHPCRLNHSGERYVGNGYCVSCARETSRAWRKANKERRSAYEKQRRRISLAVLFSDPKEIYFETDARRRKLAKVATPSWADRSAIRKMFENALAYTQRYTTEFQVEHIIPLRHRNVCGLHLAENLKVVSKKLYSQRGRRFDQKKQSDEYFFWLKRIG